MGLLYVGTNIFLRNEKKMIYEKNESRKRSTELSVYKINRLEINNKKIS